MEENKDKKVIMLSLASLLIGSLLYIFGMSLDNQMTMIVNYAIAMLLYICSFLAVFNNNKINPKAIYKYLMVLSSFLLILITIASLSKMI
ncbi:MAG: hypothetical protein RR630_00510 [Coprobacillus sp.]